MQYIDINFWMRGDILRKSDHISMAHGLEVRVPYLDAEVAGAAFSVPVRYRVNRRQTKSVFRSVSDGYPAAGDCQKTETRISGSPSKVAESGTIRGNCESGI